MPENLQIQQQKRNLVFLTWRNSQSSGNNVSANNGDVRYLVEERHLIGPRYMESRLSSWTVCHVSTKPQATLRDRLKTGHWYQFRVAAVNGNGSRGYSQPSRPFKTKGGYIRTVIRANLVYYPQPITPSVRSFALKKERIYLPYKLIRECFILDIIYNMKTY